MPMFRKGNTAFMQSTIANDAHGIGNTTLHEVLDSFWDTFMG